MSNSEYSPGSVIRLKSVQNNVPIEATVWHAYIPFTMSPVLRVSLAPDCLAALSGTDAPAEMILKLYDRRYLINVREEYGDTNPTEYTWYKQAAYAEYLLALQNEQKKPIDFGNMEMMMEADLSDGEFEGYMAHWAKKLYETELQTYEDLHLLQGKRIPRLYSAVLYTHPHSIPDPVPGLLLEYIPSLSLRQFIQYDPPWSPSLVRRVCNDAVKLVDEVSDHEVLNEDVRVDNVLVRLSALSNVEDMSPACVACVLIDLSHCRKRRSDEGEEEWMRAKWSQDEEGAVGYVAQREVRDRYPAEQGEVWNYKPSLRYYRPMQEEPQNKSESQLCEADGDPTGNLV